MVAIIYCVTSVSWLVHYLGVVNFPKPPVLSFGSTTSVAHILSLKNKYSYAFENADLLPFCFKTIKRDIAQLKLLILNARCKVDTFRSYLSYDKINMNIPMILQHKKKFS